MKINNKSGFSLAEICIVLVVLGCLVILITTASFRTPQGQFTAKFNKISALITSNIERAIASRSGFRYGDYALNNNQLFSDVTAGLEGSECTSGGKAFNTCWSSTLNIGGFNLGNNFRAFTLNNEAVIAIENDNAGTNIIIDVNGTKGPNEVGRDIMQYSAIYENDPQAIRPNQQVAWSCKKPATRGEQVLDANCNYVCTGVKNVANGLYSCQCPAAGAPPAPVCARAANWTYNNSTCTYDGSCGGSWNFDNATGCCVCNLGCGANQVLDANNCTCNAAPQQPGCIKNKCIKKTEGTINVCATIYQTGGSNYQRSASNYKCWRGQTYDYCFEGTTHCLQIIKGSNGDSSVLNGAVVNKGYYCEVYNGGFECHINASQVPDVKYDKNGNVVSVVCNKFSGQLGNCSTSIAGCTTAHCDWDNNEKKWKTSSDEESAYLYNAVRCLWAKSNGNTPEGCENYALPD